MAENVCLMFTEAETTNALVRVLSLAAASVDMRKRTVIYVDGHWLELAKAGYLEQQDRELKRIYKGQSVLDLFRHFQNGGGELWVSAIAAQRRDLSRLTLIAGVRFVDELTLLTFLHENTLVLNF